jgi:V/A-type H+-transporting ATPase subunit C
MPVISPRSVSAYAQVQATVRALYSTLLTSDTWASLIRAQDFDAVLSLLSKTVYGPHLQLERHLLTPRRSEYQIRWHLAEVYEKLIRLTPEPGSDLLIRLWRLYEVHNLKATLRGIETGASWDQVLHLLAPGEAYFSLTFDDMEAMVRAGTISRAIHRIQHTSYYATLIHALERYEAEQNLFPLEVALDLEYRRGLWESIDRLKGQDHEEALELVGTVLDVDNLLWAIRYRVYHHLSEEEIINYTLPLGYRVQDEDIRAIAAGEDIAAVVRRIYPEIEGVQRLPEDLNVDEETSPTSVRPIDRRLWELERVLEGHIADLCRARFLRTPFHIGLPVAYLLLNEYEIIDLTMLIESKVSDVSIQQVKFILGYASMSPMSGEEGQA